ncbi:FAD-dependent oxidoreductase [Longimicrobium sp.]|uniref:FAD-dependent oxidoreductase n=1 Tax=Longimicrobium sp. TaxID=2029185 RepID=UPI002CA577F6|nr:FAD-dependent oxidoreductase [Longimicrobium sp.]HSU13578.1 FAD-dependent oxidoreductase [Longimicrobium sp.]
MSRRGFVAAAAGIAAAAIVGCAPKSGRALAGGFVDDGGARGHRLRDGARFPAPRRTVRMPLVIVGGGVAGLSAAWRLAKRGFDGFALLELEDRAGGNARWGENEVSAYPWAAHYVPVPGRETVLVRELFEELGVWKDGGWDETVLVQAPKERLYRFGAWREGLREPLMDSAADRAEFRRFDQEMAEMRATGAFTLPLSAGARPSPLDGGSMARWLDERGFRSPALRWYVDYACRDDYGALAADVSAWAGVHYFASRPPEDDELGPLAWPEGNGWIVRRLMERLGRFVSTGTTVHRVERRGAGMRVLAGDAEYVCDAVVWAAPSFVASRVVEGAPAVDFAYSPWLTANLTLDRWPGENGFPPAWDNVIANSPGLGYVVANHQTLRTFQDRWVWTYYHALAHASPSAARRSLLAGTWRDAADAVLADLERAHPDVRRCVRRIDIMRMGHAMVRPTPGFLASPARLQLRAAAGPVFYAHSDLSGLSLFEEAQSRGVTAAERALAYLGGGAGDEP